VLVIDNMQDRGPKGTTPWTRYEITVDVPTEGKAIYFGALHPGNGTAWFDSLQLEMDGAVYQGAEGLDLDFESDNLAGFHTGGAGYEVALDKEVAHTGKQSVRIQQYRSENQRPTPAEATEVHELSWKGK
jgi:hypothetical protein